MNENETPRQASTREETDVKCPSCAAAMGFDPASGKLHCEYCGYIKDIARSVDGLVELDFYSAEHTASFRWGVEKKAVICKSCGAESIYDALETADVCPFCGSNQVMEQTDLSGNSIAPGGIVPFAIDKKNAGQRFIKWLKKRLFAPRDAKNNAAMDRLKGVYLPYWTFDCDTTSRYTAQIGFDRRVKRGKDYVIVTDWRGTSGVYVQFIDDQLVYASTKDYGVRISSVEPYDLKRAVAYTPEYVAGFAAQRYSIGLKEGWDKAREYIHAKLSGMITGHIRSKTRADHVSSLHFDTLHENVTYKYLLVPLWISSYRYRDKQYNFIINGQTGKVHGKAPVSPLRVFIAVMIGIALLIGAYFTVNYLSDQSYSEDSGYYYVY